VTFCSISQQIMNVFQKKFEAVQHGLRTNRLHFGSGPELDPDPGFFNPNRDLYLEIFVVPCG